MFPEGTVQIGISRKSSQFIDTHQPSTGSLQGRVINSTGGISTNSPPLHLLIPEKLSLIDLNTSKAEKDISPTPLSERATSLDSVISPTMNCETPTFLRQRSIESQKNFQRQNSIYLLDHQLTPTPPIISNQVVATLLPTIFETTERRPAGKHEDFSYTNLDVGTETSDSSMMRHSCTRSCSTMCMII